MSKIHAPNQADKSVLPQGSSQWLGLFTDAVPSDVPGFDCQLVPVRVEQKSYTCVSE